MHLETEVGLCGDVLKTHIQLQPKSVGPGWEAAFWMSLMVRDTFLVFLANDKLPVTMASKITCVESPTHSILVKVSNQI